MKTELHVFENEEFGKVRVLEKDGQPWFVGKDVAEVLGYGNGSRDINRHVDEEDRKTEVLPQYQNGTLVSKTIIINESGLYSLILSSKLPGARKFKRWVTSEVLPAVRKYGLYVTDETLEKIVESPFFATQIFKTISDERKKAAELQKRVAEYADKARYYDAVLQCANAVPVSVIAKDYGMSAAAFNKLLHGLRVQYKLGETWLLYQQYADQGYTATRTFRVNEDTAKVQTCWTQRGRIFIYYLLARCGISPSCAG